MKRPHPLLRLLKRGKTSQGNKFLKAKTKGETCSRLWGGGRAADGNSPAMKYELRSASKQPSQLSGDKETLKCLAAVLQRRPPSVHRCHSLSQDSESSIMNFQRPPLPPQEKEFLGPLQRWVTRMAMWQYQVSARIQEWLPAVTYPVTAFSQESWKKCCKWRIQGVLRWTLWG